MSASVSSTEVILIMAADADWRSAYTSESSCNGWNTSCSRYVSVISAPMVSEPSARSWAPTSNTAQVEITPSSSIEGKNTENRRWATTLDERLASFSSSNWAWNARSRLKAWITVMPATDSAIWAVTPLMVFRTFNWATDERR